ncbi:amidohydrolase [Gordonia sp. (in: high G+C Gram-positive bacteria)]|uniref:amidohydrolase n=1 Tax=Gordonia sp. (in: high G+C Gram-positive bacteria) TaxID=84139 RepID=UPI003F9E68B5
MGTTAELSAVLNGISDIREWQEELYRNLHSRPELSHHEHDTAETIVQRLENTSFDVHAGVGGTGVVGVLHNGAGPTVLFRADMDALPVREATDLPYASTETVVGDGGEIPVMHAFGHDVHVTCLLGATQLLSDGVDNWSGTAVLVFQPAEETGDGARSMLDDRLTDLVGDVDVALAQHVLPAPAGHVGTRSGPVLSAADSMRITVHGRGGHGSMPQATVDPVVLAAMIVVRLQTVVSREVAPAEPAVLTVGRLTAGSKSNIIPDEAVIELNIRTYSSSVRDKVLAAISRIVVAECQASGCPKDPDFELFDRFPATVNDAEATAKVTEAFDAYFGDNARPLPLQTASEDFSDIPDALGVPYTYWGIGGIDPEVYQAAEDAGRVSADVPVNHSASFAPVVQPTLDTGTQALVVAALAWL